MCRVKKNYLEEGKGKKSKTRTIIAKSGAEVGKLSDKEKKITFGNKYYTSLIT